MALFRGDAQNHTRALHLLPLQFKFCVVKHSYSSWLLLYDSWLLCWTLCGVVELLFTWSYSWSYSLSHPYGCHWWPHLPPWSGGPLGGQCWTLGTCCPTQTMMVFWFPHWTFLGLWPFPMCRLCCVGSCWRWRRKVMVGGEVMKSWGRVVQF